MTLPPPRFVRSFCVLLVVAAVVPAGVAAEEQVVGRPQLTVESPDDRLSPGQETQLRVFVSNDGDLTQGGPAEFVERVTTARGTVVEVGDGDAPIEVETGSYPVGRVPEGTSGPFSLDVTVAADAEPGTYRLPVRLRYSYTRIVTYDPTDGSAPSFSETTVERRTTLTVVVEDEPRFAVTDVASDAQVGDRGTLVLSVRNVGSQRARDASVVVTSPNDELTFGGAAGRSEGFVGSWGVGETKQVTYPVVVAGDADVREYTLGVRVTYDDVDGIARTSEPLTTSLTPQPEQSFSLTNVESSLRVDRTGTVRGTVVNDGPNPVSSPVVVVTTTNPNLDVAESEYALPDLAPGERADFAFDVDVTGAADAGSRQLTFAVRYRNEDGDRLTSDTLDARVSVDPRRDVFAVDPLEATLSAGDSGVLRLRVTNTDDEPLSAIGAKLFLNDPLSSEDDEAFVDELAPGESTELVFELRAGGGAFAKTYPASLDFEYDRPDGTTEVSETYRVPVTVTTRDRGGDLPIAVVGAVVVLVVVGAGIVLYRRR